LPLQTRHPTRDRIQQDEENHRGRHQRRPEVIEQRRRVLLGIAPEGFIAACRSLMSADLTGQLGAIHKSTRVICGELDAATPPLLCRLLADKIPNASYLALPGCGHCPPLEQPDAFIRAIEDFLV
jgi:3-oxoadipate enol-lactonase